MNDVLTASIFGILTLLLWGSGAWFLAESSRRKFSGIQVNFAVQSVSLPIAIVLLIFSNVSLGNLRHIVLIVLANAVFTCAFLAFIKALSKGPTGVVVPLQSVYPIYLLILSIVFLGQKFSAGQIVSVLMIVAGVFLVAYEGQKRKKLLDLSIDKKMAILSGILWGFGNFIFNGIVDEVSWQTLYSISNISVFIFALFLILTTSNNNLAAIKKSLKHKRALFAGLVVTLGSLSFALGATTVGSVVIILSVASAEPLVASLLSRIFDKEILSIHKRIGAVIVVSALVILNVYG
ncbi:MAG: DMT family transporter [Candidatus Saccharimonadales bacterium]